MPPLVVGGTVRPQPPPSSLSSSPSLSMDPSQGAPKSIPRAWMRCAQGAHIDNGLDQERDTHTELDPVVLPSPCTSPQWTGTVPIHPIPGFKMKSAPARFLPALPRAQRGTGTVRPGVRLPALQRRTHKLAGWLPW